MKNISIFKRDDYKEWVRKVSSVFDIRPRDASNPANKIWLTRDKQEKELKNALFSAGVHVCIDGPTGTGKSSLALTGLGITNTKYIPIQLVESMTWIDFCKNLVWKTPSQIEQNYSYGVEAGISSGLPTGKIQANLGRTIKQPISREEQVSGWNEHDICKELDKQGISLLIDDFENASEELIIRISDMARLLTQSYSNNSCKLIIVGTDDVYRRLYNKRRSLEGRLVEISLGSFSDRNSSWKYLLMGFDELKLFHPANSKIEDERKKVESCIQAIYEGADGLPKSLTQLGSEIAIKSFDRTSVTAYDIKSCSYDYIKKHIKRYHKRYGDILKEMKTDSCAREIIKYIILEGSGNIHHIDDLIDKLGSQMESAKLYAAIEELVKSQILVQTGINNDILFIRDLSLIHTFSVVADQPGKFGYDPLEFAPLKQMGLGFL